MRTPDGAGRHALRLVAVYVGLIALFVLGLTAVYSLPQDRIIANAATSAGQLREEGLGRSVLLSDIGYRVDNFTDALMIDCAIIDPPVPAFRAAMGVVHGNVEEDGRILDPITALTETVEGRRTPDPPYARYWHGYQVVLRPALMLFDHQAIRYFNIIALGFLTVLVLLGLQSQAGRAAAIAFAAALALAGYIVVPGSIQLANMTYLMLAAMLAVMASIRSGRFARRDIELFFVFGMLTAFFDLLTTPLLTLGMPLAVALIIRARDVDVRLREQLAFAAKVSACWSVGYVGSWLAKLVIASVALERNVLADGARTFLFRSGFDGGPVRLGDALGENLTRLAPLLHTGAFANIRWTSVGPLDVAVGAVLLATVALVVRRLRPWVEVRRAMHVLLVVPLPYLWFVVANNHSFIHSYFTYRIQLMAVFAVLFVLASAVGRDHGRRGSLYWRRSFPEVPHS